MEQREWYIGCGFCKPKKTGPYAVVDDPKRITTINLPILYQNAIVKLVDMGLYDSKSQVVRICVDKFLEREKRFKEELTKNNIKCNKAIITVNLPKRSIKIISDEFVDHFVGAKPLYPSRSELVRVAVRDMLMEIYICEQIKPISEPDPHIFVDRKGKQWYIGDEI